MKNFNSLENKSILLTGGAGFIGSHLATNLLKFNLKKLRIIDNLSTGKKENIQHLLDHENVEFIEGDLQDFNLVKEIVKGIDLICHQAATGSVPRSLEMPYFYHQNNVITFLNLLECARNEGIKRVVYASSSSVYGDSELLPKKEEVIGKSLSIYATTKYMNECDAHIYHRCYGMETIGLRYFNIFGPRQNPNGMYAAVIPKFIEKIKNNDTITINGDGSFSRDFTFVDNAVTANILSLTTTNEEAFGKAFNIASSIRITLNILVELLKKLANKDVDVEHGPERKGDIPHSFANIENAQQQLKYEVITPFTLGLKQTFEYFNQ